ncbi:hypothetical protein MRS44_003787 [Fusarium solani]|uniref:uncharacterized protein n=1 Tax=Fusarium solani TaxID=169388 RepID=UPI0032C4AE16|nr:hypothetical protein MRS44_003787 [Fusarium solani]
MEDPETVPKIFGGEVEVTVVDPVLDVAGAELREWIKDARHDPVVSVALQLSIKSTGILREAPPIRKKPLGLLGTWAKIVPVAGMLPLDQRNCIYHCFSQILLMALESMAITRPSLSSGPIFLVVSADQLNNHLPRVVSSQASAYDTEGLPPIHVTHGPLGIDGLVECITGGSTQIMYPRGAASVGIGRHGPFRCLAVNKDVMICGLSPRHTETPTSSASLSILLDRILLPGSVTWHRDTFLLDN